MKRGTFAAVVAVTLLISNVCLARTWGSHNYESDIGKDPNHLFGKFYDMPGYEDPDFQEAKLLPSPLYNPVYATYDLIVVITKSDSKVEGSDLVEKGQRIRVYARAEALDRLKPEQTQLIEKQYDPQSGLLYYWKVSTGKSGDATPSGFFVPQGFSSDHESSIYGNAPMPWAVFINGNVAAHATLGFSIGILGTRASHGCVRLEPQRAEDLFHLVGLTGKGEVDGINAQGNWILDPQGNPRKGVLYKTLFVIRGKPSPVAVNSLARN